MKKILSILAGMMLVGASVGPVTAVDAKDNVGDVRDGSPRPSKVDADFNYDTGEVALSWDTTVSILNNKGFPNLAEPEFDWAAGAKKENHLIPEKYMDPHFKDRSENGYGFRLSTDAVYRGRTKDDKSNTWRVYDWSQYADEYEYTLGTQGKWASQQLQNMNLRDEKMTLLNSAEGEKINHTELSDQDAQYVNVGVHASFKINLPDMPMMLNIQLGGWGVSWTPVGLGPGSWGEGEDGYVFRMWMPSKKVTKDMDKNNGKNPIYNGATE